MYEHLLSRRNILGAVAASAVGGCVPFAKTSPFWGTISAGVGGQADVPQVGRAYADRLPYASMLAWFKGAPKALLVLAEIEPNQRWIWRSAERQTLTTRGPYISSLVGTDLELRSTLFQGRWAPNPVDMAGKRMVRVLDVAGENHRTQVALESRFKLADVENLEIEGVEYRTQRVIEAVYNDGRRRFENEYWVETTTGRCWKSRQVVLPTWPVFTIEMMKYPNA